VPILQGITENMLLAEQGDAPSGDTKLSYSLIVKSSRSTALAVKSKSEKNTYKPNQFLLLLCGCAGVAKRGRLKICWLSAYAGSNPVARIFGENADSKLRKLCHSHLRSKRGLKTHRVLLPALFLFACTYLFF
jgi:hypothetical protein